VTLRVLLIMDPFIRVPPVHYGGIERVIADLAAGLTARGHKVTLWGAPGSRVDGKVEPFGRENEWTDWSNLRNTGVITARLLSQLRNFDVVHNFGRLAYLTAILPVDIPKIQTYMRTVNPVNMRKVARLKARRMHFTAVSEAIRHTGAPGGGEWSVIYNCAPTSQYSFRGDVNPNSAPLVFLGRIERCKGAHTAIQVARSLGRQLLVAGNVSTLPHEMKYFKQEVEPFIDGDLVRYVGVVKNVQKNELLGSAAALLVPIEWEEPFPVILPEALLCGTPVIGFRRGGVPEGIAHEKTGFICDTAEEMQTYVGRLAEIDRRECRAQAEMRFSDSVIVGEYEALYMRSLGTVSDKSVRH
jgi:glycosyltransferase involved in cell wall biosynthesis